jgi:hypothetical protein
MERRRIRAIYRGRPEALAEKLRHRRDDAKPWMKSFGKLRGLRKETARINRIIKAEFGFRHGCFT